MNLLAPEAGRSLALETLRVDSSGVLDELAVPLLIDPHVGRDIAINKVESEEGELGASRLKSKREPVCARGQLGGGGLLAQREVRPVVSQAINRLAQGQRVGGFGRVIRLGLEGNAVRDTGIRGVRCRSLVDASQISDPDGDAQGFDLSTVDGGVSETWRAMFFGWRIVQITSGRPGAMSSTWSSRYLVAQ